MLFLIYDLILPVRPAQMELKLSEFFTMADGERRERPVGKSLHTHLSSLVKAKTETAQCEMQVKG